MKRIKENEDKFIEKPVNADMNDNYLIPGVSGLKVNYKESFSKMKQYGTYNESLLVFKEVMPTISMDDYYDKYIMAGRGVNNDVSLVFRVESNDDITEVLNTLDKTGVVATFFIDGLWLDNNVNLVTEMTFNSHQIEILNYHGTYDEIYFSNALGKLQRITNLKPKYCYALYDQKEVLELCSKLKLHTVIPTIKTGNYPFQEVKRKLNKGAIVGFTMNSSTNIELETVINYIKQKGYELNTLDYLLLEIKNNQK